MWFWCNIKEKWAMNAICWRRACQAKSRWCLTTALGWVTNIWDWISLQFFPSALLAEVTVNAYFGGTGPLPFFFSSFLRIQYYTMKVQHLCFCATGMDWVSNKKGKENITKCILLIVVEIWRYEQLLFSSQHVSAGIGLSSHPGENESLWTNCITAGPGCDEFSIL